MHLITYFDLVLELKPYLSFYNHMKRIFTLLLSVIALHSFAQTPTNVRPFGCGSEPSQEYLDWFNSLDMQRYLDGGRTNATIYIPVQIHLIAKADGTGRISINQAMDVVCALNTFYKPADIYFYMPYNINIIRDDNYNQVNDYTEGNSIQSIYNRTNVVNIYFCDLSNFSGAGFAICGYASLPGSGVSGPGGAPFAQGGMFIGNGTCASPSGTTVPHEMGHYLSLLHPFQTTYQNPTSSQAELVARPGATGKTFAPNCSTNGDRLCDTEADYLQGGWTGCNMVHTQKDRNQDTFQPDVTLYMSYSPDNCQTRFSNDQMNQMRATANSNSPSNGRGYLQNLRASMPPVDTIRTTPQLMTPANNSTNNVANWTYFQWKSVPGATKYYIQCSTSSAFLSTRMIFEDFTTDTSYTYKNNSMNTGTTYYWRVRPIRESYLCTFNSAYNQFTCSSKKGLSVSGLEDGLINVYPTLVGQGDKVTVALNGEIANTLKIQVMDIAGKIVHTEVRADLLPTSIFELNTPSMAYGVYSIVLTSGDKRYIRKIVVQ